MGGLRIAIVASTLETGGAERVVELLVPRLVARGHDVAVELLRRPGAIGRRLARAGFVVRSGRGGGRRAPRAALALARRFRRRRPDVVFCLDHRDAMFAGRMAARLAGVGAVVVGSHATGLVGRRSAFGPVERWLMADTDCVVALSRAHARHLREAEALDARIAVIPNGIDVDAFAPAPGAREAAREALGLAADEFVVAMVAALRPEKAHEAFVDAVERLAARGVAVRGLMAGDGPRRDEVEAMVARSRAADRILRLGRRDDVARILHASDALLLPSHDVVETLPLVVLEAMAAGVAVVASAVGSVPEVVRPGETGWTIPPADGEAAARALGEIHRRPEAARAVVECARREVRERFTVERMTDDYDRLFRELVNS